MLTTALSTAIEAWDKRWATAEGRADWLHPDPDVVALLPELKARGKWINLWTVNDPADMKRLISEGAGGIMTDRPDLLRNLLG